jgi:Rhs element Vgr protein
VSNDATIPTPATPDVCTVAVLIDGSEIPGIFHLLSVSITQELNRIPSAVLHLMDGEAASSTFEASNAELFVPGKKIAIQLGYRSQNDSVFKGIIIKHSIKIRKAASLLVVECRNEAVKMTNGIKSRYYTDKLDSDIMEEILGLYGLQNEVTATIPDLKEVVQYEATDWDFLLCRAEANGHVVCVGDEKVIIAPPDTGSDAVLKVNYGSTILELDAEIDSRWQSKGIKANSWNPTDQEVMETEASEPATTNNGNLSPSTLADVIGGEADTIRHGGKLSQPELQAWADGRLLKERLAKVRGRVRFQGFAGVLPGKIIEVSGIGERFEGKLYVSGVRHTVANGNWETDVQFGLNPEIFSATHNLRPLPAGGLLPGVSGLQIGVVTVLESDPDDEERIKVRLPLVSVSEEGIWARIATLDAGKERGTFFRPEIGDEVVVGFLGDDPRYPVVLGMCHSSAKPAPESAKDTNHHKGYVSREKMKLTFDDEKKIMLFETPGGNKLTLSEDKKGIIIEDQNGNKITLDDSGIKIESVKDLILKASSDMNAEGMNISLKAQTGFKASGTASAEVSGASTTLKGSATTTISGGVVQIN